MGGKFTVPLGNSDLSFSQKQFIVDSNYSFAICKDGQNVSTIFDLNEIVLWHQNNPKQGDAKTCQLEDVLPIPENILLSPPIAKYTDKNISCDSTPAENIWKNHSDLKIIKLRQDQEAIKNESDMEQFQSVYILRISSLKTQEDIDNYKEDIMTKFEIVEPTKVEIEKSKKVANNSQAIRKLQNVLRSYYNDILVGNVEQQVLYYLQDLKKASEGNAFDAVIGRILSFDVSYEEEYMLSTDEEQKASFMKCLKSIFCVCEVLFELVQKNKYRNQYELIRSIHIVTSKDNIDIELTALQSNETIEYMLQGNTLTVYNEDIIDIEFLKNEYVYNEDINISNEDAVKNYLYLLLSFKDFDANSKLSTVLCIIMIVVLGVYHYTKMEHFIMHNVLQDDESINKMIEYIEDKFKNNNSVESAGYSSKVVNAKCRGTCPVVLKLYGAEDTENSPSPDDPLYEEWMKSEDRFIPLYVPSNVSIEDDYFIEFGNMEYTITHAVYEEDNTSKKVTEVKLMAVGSNDNSCRSKSLNMLPFDITDGQRLNVYLKKKNITDIRSDYTDSGNDLRKINSKLEKYKTNINRLSKKNDNQLRMMKNIDIRSYIYYVIFAVIVIAGLGIFIFDINQLLKLYVMLAILGVIVLMNIVNYFLNYDVIEGFNVLKKQKEHFENQEGVGSDFIIKYEFLNNSLANTNGEDYSLKNVGNITLVLESADSPSHVIFNGSSYLEIPNQNCDLSVFSVTDFTIEFSMYIPSDILAEQEVFTIIDTYSKDENNNHKGWFIELTQNNLNVNVAIDEKRGVSTTGVTSAESIESSETDYQISNKIKRNSYLFDKFDEWVTVRVDVNKVDNSYNVTCLYSTVEEPNIEAENVDLVLAVVEDPPIISSELSLGTPLSVRIGNRNQEHIGDKDYIIRNGVKMKLLRYVTSRNNITDGVCKNGGDASENVFETINELSPEDKRSFVNESNNNMAEILNELLENYIVYLLSSQSNNLYKTITDSLKNEIKTFTGYEQNYKYKIESDEKSLNAMKHEMIQKTGMINFLSVSFLIVAVIVLLYVYVNTNKYNEIFIGIVVILLLINLYQYYYTILHPVRTKAINKYWYKISNENEQIMS
jgi:hypothetical protein